MTQIQDQQLHIDDAFEFLVEYLSKKQRPKGRPTHNDRPYDSDIWVPIVAHGYWSVRSQIRGSDQLEEIHTRPFYDAAWTLCRMGVLRPGKVAPIGQSMGGNFSGDGYAITETGWVWIAEKSKTPPTDPSRISALLNTFTAKFGDGYAQRAAEASRCYQSANYLATCVMSGAAAESILLALAVAKVGDEHKVIAEYATAQGRGRISKRIIGNVTEPIARQFTTATQILHYWRDDASHGTWTTITELEAHASISQLLRFAQFASDNWGALTSN